MKHISFHKPTGKYQVRAWVDGKRTTVGYAATIKDAETLRDQYDTTPPVRSRKTMRQLCARLAAETASPAVTALAAQLGVHTSDLMVVIDKFKRENVTFVTAQGDVL